MPTPPAGPGEFIVEGGPPTGALSRLAEQQMAERKRDAELRYEGLLAPAPPQDLQQEYEQKLSRRQFLFRKAAEHRVPPEELMKRLRIEGLEDVKMPEAPEQMPKGETRRIIKDVEGYQRYADTGERVFPGAIAPKGEIKSKDRPSSADYKFINTSILNTMLAGSNVEVKEFINDATGTINEGLLRQKLKTIGEEDRYKLWTKVKQYAQRALRDTELTPEDAMAYAFKAAGVESLLSGYEEPQEEQRLPAGATTGQELIEFEPGKQGYPVYDTGGQLIGYDWIK